MSPPDVHAMIRPGAIHLVHGPTENGHRPAIDPLFRTAAEAYGERAIGVVLSGVLDDGTAGLSAIKGAGGVAVVQSPGDALYPAMPRIALSRVDVDYVVPSAEIGDLLGRLARESPPVATGNPPAPGRDPPRDAIEQALDLREPVVRRAPGVVSGLSCPDCNGALWEVHEGGITKFRCRVGHVWTEAALLLQQGNVLEVALWTALRVLGERADLARQIHDRAVTRGHQRAASLFADRLEEFDQDVKVLRAVLARPELAALDERLGELAHVAEEGGTPESAEPPADDEVRGAEGPDEAHRPR